MSSSQKRSQRRRDYAAPIQYASFKGEAFHDAIMYNCSTSGMYFESECCPQPRSDICIRVLNYQPTSSGPEAYRFYRANVRWCRYFSTASQTRYGVGVHYLARSHCVDGPNYWCDLCGMTIALGNVHFMDHYIYLCPDCRKQLDALPEGRIKESIRSLMIGNVL